MNKVLAFLYMHYRICIQNFIDVIMSPYVTGES